jgi:hypothetical protein
VAIGQPLAADKESALEIMSTDPASCSLKMSWLWGGMAVNHVTFADHRGPFKAVMESTGKGIRITFDGWGETPFTASTDKGVRIISLIAGKKEIDFTAEAVSPTEVRVRLTDGHAVSGKRIVMGLGNRDQAPTLFVEGRGGFIATPETPRPR